MPKQPNKQRHRLIKNKRERAVIAGRNMATPPPPKKAQPGKGGGDKIIMHPISPAQLGAPPKSRILDEKPFCPDGVILDSTYRVTGRTVAHGRLQPPRKIVEGPLSEILVAQDQKKFANVLELILERRITTTAWAVMTHPKFLAAAREQLTLLA